MYHLNQLAGMRKCVTVHALGKISLFFQLNGQQQYKVCPEGGGNP